jgi:hypothetical protein
MRHTEEQIDLHALEGLVQGPSSIPQFCPCILKAPHGFGDMLPSPPTTHNY